MFGKALASIRVWRRELGRLKIRMSATCPVAANLSVPTAAIDTIATDIEATAMVMSEEGFHMSEAVDRSLSWLMEHHAYIESDQYAMAEAWDNFDEGVMGYLVQCGLVTMRRSPLQHREYALIANRMQLMPEFKTALSKKLVGTMRLTVIRGHVTEAVCA